MSKYSEQYRGRTIVVIRDDQFPAVMENGITHLTVAQARRSVDHRLDRSCAAHGPHSNDSMQEFRKHGPYAGVRLAEAGNVSVATLAFLTLALVPVGLVATFVGSLVGAIAGTF